MVDFPNNPLDKSTVGWFRFTRLNRLKISPRISSVAPSWPKNQGMCTALIAFRLTFARPGPENVLRPRFPSCPFAGTGKSLLLKTPAIYALRETEIVFPNDGAFGKS